MNSNKELNAINHLFSSRNFSHKISHIDIEHISSNIAIETPSDVSAELGFSYELKIGAFTHINGGFIQNATIGRYCSFARDVHIGQGTHPTDWLSVTPLQYNPNYRGWINKSGKNSPLKTRKFKWDLHTTIGSDVWIGHSVFIQDGISIGHGAIVGAGSIVTKNIPPFAIAAGNPARVLRFRFPTDVIIRLLETEWWNYHISEFKDIDYSNIYESLEIIENLIKEKKIEKYQPTIISSHMLRCTARLSEKTSSDSSTP